MAPDIAGDTRLLTLSIYLYIYLSNPNLTLTSYADSVSEQMAAEGVGAAIGA